MKANEMPEKIYLFDYNDAMVTPLEGDTVYVREEAFIEKACDWLRENKNHWAIESDDPCLSGFLTDDFINDFKNYMKGE
jgi:hypothetical protein